MEQALYRWPRTLHSLGVVLRQSNGPSLLVYPLALEFFFNEVIKRSIISHQLSHCSIIVRELPLELFNLFKLKRVKTPIFRMSLIKSCITNVITVQYLSHGYIAFGFF